MSYKESYGRAATIAKEALEQMDRLQLASHPDNFEIWYASMLALLPSSLGS